MNVITLHTAQDVCVGGNADTLAELFNLKNIKLFAMTNDKYGAGRIGDIDGILVSKFNELVESILNTKSIRTNEFFYKIKEVKRIAILPGSGTQFIDEIIEDIDIYVTGDISHRYLLKADDARVGLLQIGHISSEIPGMKRFVNKLNNALSKELEYIYREFYE
jgi:putative NIF3 family GTP cyclohydrolase 1 type 2